MGINGPTPPESEPVEVLGGLGSVVEVPTPTETADGEIIGGLADTDATPVTESVVSDKTQEETMYNRVRRIAGMFSGQEKGEQAQQLHGLLQEGKSLQKIQESNPELIGWYNSQNW